MILKMLRPLNTFQTYIAIVLVIRLDSRILRDIAKIDKQFKDKKYSLLHCIIIIIYNHIFHFIKHQDLSVFVIET